MADGVEVAFLDGLVVVRHSKHPHAAVLVFDADEWAVFTAGVRAGEFDLPALRGRLTVDGSDGNARTRACDGPEARVEPSRSPTKARP